MRVWINGFLTWMCSECGHTWRARCEETPPIHCAKCNHRGWNRERDVVAELPGSVYVR